MPGHPAVPGMPGQGAQLGARCRSTWCWVRGDTERCWVKAGRQHSHAGDTRTWAGWAGPSRAWCWVLGRHISLGVLVWMGR